MNKIYSLKNNSNIFIKNKKQIIPDIITLKKINCFIGNNNSGKSRTLRHLMNNNSKDILSQIELSDNNLKNLEEIPNVILKLFTNIKNYNNNNNNNNNNINNEDLTHNIKTKYSRKKILEEYDNAYYFLPTQTQKAQSIYNLYNLYNLYDIKIWTIEIINEIYPFITSILKELKKIYLSLNNQALTNYQGLSNIYDEDFYQLYLKYFDMSGSDKNPCKIIFDGLNNIASNNQVISTIRDIDDIKLSKLITDIETNKKHLLYFKYYTTYTYIPILRGLRMLDLSPSNSLSDNLDHYIQRTKKDYQLKEDISIFTGLTLFSEIKNWLLGNRIDRNKVNEFEDFLSRHLFDNQEVSITVPETHGSDVVNIKIGNAEERPIYSLGDGIQQLIILLFPFFKTKEEKDITICIEEPETHLHPKWQRLFIDIIAKEFPNHHVFFTTHSNAFINHEAVDVYKVEKKFEDKEEITIISDAIWSDKKQIIKDLGYEPSDFLNDKYIIWVEGKSDIPYIEKFISVYSDGQLIRDEHYSCMWLGSAGNFKDKDLEKDDFPLHKLSNNLSIILDSDLKHIDENNSLNNDKSKIFTKEKKEHLEKIFRELNIEKNVLFWVSHCREVENLISFEHFEELIYLSVKITYPDLEKNNFCLINENKNRYFDDRFANKNNNPFKYQITIDNQPKQHNLSPKLKQKLCQVFLEESSFNIKDIEESPELAYYIPKLCKAIYLANNMNKEANEITDEYLTQAKENVDAAIKAETKRIEELNSDHQSNLDKIADAPPIDEKITPDQKN